MAERPWLRRLGSLGGRTILILAVLAVLVAAADRAGAVLDLSPDRRFTLSQRLSTLIAAQTEAVELVSIWRGEDDGAFEPLRAALARMAAITPLVLHRHLDPELQKPLLAAFAERHGEAQERSLYVTRGARAFRIALDERSRLYLQRDVGGALLTLAQPALAPARLLQGHGELRPGGGGEDGADRLAHLLTLAGFEVAPIGPDRRADPAPEAVLVVAGPTAALGERDLRLLNDHLRDGGGALLAVDDRTPPDLGAWLRRRGLLSDAARPIDPQALLDAGAAIAPATVLVSLRHHVAGREAAFPNHNLAIVAANPEHAASQSLAGSGRVLLLPWTVGLDALPPAAFGPRGQAMEAAYAAIGTPPFAPVWLLASEPGDVWMKPRAAPLAAPDQLAQAPARALAWALEYAPAADSVRAGMGGRLVVLGSRQALSDGVLAQDHFANGDLVRAAATWLARRAAAQDIPAAEVASFQVRAGDGALTAILVLLLAVLPCACLGAAMLMWWDRR